MTHFFSYLFHKDWLVDRSTKSKHWRSSFEIIWFETLKEKHLMKFGNNDLNPIIYTSLCKADTRNLALNINLYLWHHRKISFIKTNHMLIRDVSIIWTQKTRLKSAPFSTRIVDENGFQVGIGMGMGIALENEYRYGYVCGFLKSLHDCVPDLLVKCN